VLTDQSQSIIDALPDLRRKKMMPSPELMMQSTMSDTLNSIKLELNRLNQKEYDTTEGVMIVGAIQELESQLSRFDSQAIVDAIIDEAKANFVPNENEPNQVGPQDIVLP